jgi:uncharacterized protein
MLPRALERRFLDLLASFPVVVVIGARQVGKTTLVEQLLPQGWETVTFDPLQDIGNARADPDLFLQNRPGPLFLDEIQYAPEVVGAVKRRVDKRRHVPGQMVISGSQQWEVMKSLSESLAGRAVFLDLEGFSLTEMAGRGKRGHWLADWLGRPDAFLAASAKKRLPTPRPLFEQLWRGWLPETHRVPSSGIGAFHLAYHRTYVERDVRTLGAVDDWHHFDRFSRLMAALSAQEINFRQLGRELGIASPTARRWLGLLIGTCQWFEVAPYQGNTIKRLSGKPKGYLADTGQVCFALAVSSPRSLESHPQAGAIFETAIAGEIRKGAALLTQSPNFFHWRSHGGAEIDFLLEYDGWLFPIEVKLRAHPTLNDARGLQAFRKTYPKARIRPGLIVAPAESFSQIGPQEYVIPWDLAPL